MKIVETDNFGRDYPNEKFVDLPVMQEEALNQICKIINDDGGSNSPRYYKVVENDYKLVLGFEP